MMGVVYFGAAVFLKHAAYSSLYSFVMKVLNVEVFM